MRNKDIAVNIAGLYISWEEWRTMDDATRAQCLRLLATSSGGSSGNDPGNDDYYESYELIVADEVPFYDNVEVLPHSDVAALGAAADTAHADAYDAVIDQVAVAQ